MGEDPGTNGGTEDRSAVGRNAGDGSWSVLAGRSDRFWLMLTGVFVVTMPAFTLVAAYAVLTATRSVIVGEVTTVEVVELYLVELVAFVIFAVVLYRVTGYLAGRRGLESE